MVSGGERHGERERKARSERGREARGEREREARGERGREVLGEQGREARGERAAPPGRAHGRPGSMGSPHKQDHDSEKGRRPCS